MNNKKKVFVIDDDIDELNELRSNFDSEFDVLPRNTDKDLAEYSDAFNNRTSLENYVKKVIQDNYRDLRLVVSDIFFDGDLKQKYDGIDVIRYIRDLNIDNAHDDFLKYIPIIATSKYSGKDYLRKAYSEAKATLFINKGESDNTGKIIGLTGMGKQLITPFDAWCERVGACRYKVGFSFTGIDKLNKENHRAFVRDIAESLCRRCGISVFFDEFYDTNINAHSGKTLSEIYHSKCDKIVVFLSNDYNDSDSNVWTSDEWNLGIKPYIKETTFDNLCLLNVSGDLKKDDVLSRMFKELQPVHDSNNANTKGWDLVYKDIHEQREYFYELVQSKRNADSCFIDYFSTFKKEKLNIIVEFIMKRFHLTEIIPN